MALNIWSRAADRHPLLHASSTRHIAAQMEAKSRGASGCRHFRLPRPAILGIVNHAGTKYRLDCFRTSWRADGHFLDLSALLFRDWRRVFRASGEPSHPKRLSLAHSGRHLSRDPARGIALAGELVALQPDLPRPRLAGELSHRLVGQQQ